VKVINPSAHLPFNFELSSIGLNLLPTGLHDNRALSLNFQPELCESVCWKELSERPCLGQLAISLKVASVLMHGDMYNAIEDGKDLVVGLETFFKFQIFIPKRMCEEVEANTVGTTLK